MIWSKDALAAESERLERLFEAQKERKREIARAAAKPARKFGSLRADGFETIWIQGRIDRGPRKIAGIATTERTNDKGQRVSPSGCFARLPIPLFFGHNKVGGVPIGEVVLLRKSALGVYVIADLFSTPAANYGLDLIDSGEVRAFSTGRGLPTSDWGSVVDGVAFHSRWTLNELSICRTGSNPDATFTPFR